MGAQLPASDITVRYSGFAPDSTGELSANWTLAEGEGIIPLTALTPYTHYTLYFFGKADVSPQANAPLGTVLTIE